MQTHELKKIKLTTEGIEALGSYLQEAAMQEITIPFQELNAFIQYHYQQIITKVITKRTQMILKRQKQAQLSFNYAEMKTFSILFKNVPCSGFMLTVEFALL